MAGMPPSSVTMTTDSRSQSVQKVPAMPRRQRLALQLLNAIGGAASNLDFQKLLFLYCQEIRLDPPYEFVPYKFGAFSFTSYADRRKLVERGLLEDDDRNWKITAAGRDSVGRAIETHLSSFATRTAGIRGNDLIALTYRRFPFFAIHSEIAEKVLKGDPDAYERVLALRARPDKPEMFTIGYEGHSLESYLTALIRNGITILCDVRRNPLSRKYGFSKSTLSRCCLEIGIRYEHIPELGIASDQRQELDTQADYDALFAEYMRNWLPGQATSLSKIRDWFDAGERIALTCYEHSPAQCHRHCVADELESRFGQALCARHL